MSRLFGYVARMPVDRFRLNRTHTDADAAIGTLGFVYDRPLAYLVFDERPHAAAGAVHRWRPDSFKRRINKLFCIFSDYVDILNVVRSQANLLLPLPMWAQSQDLD